jgi:hypothetical protein
MAGELGQAGVLQVIPPAELERQLDARAKDKATAAQAATAQPDVTPLAGYIKGQWEIFRNHRNTQAGWSERLLIALRAFNGQYEPSKMQEIRKFGGSEVYARIIAQKCRAASSLLRDIYLNQDRVWAIRPPADPEIPPEIQQAIDQLMQVETQMIQQATGRPPKPTDVENRRRSLMEDARDAAKKKASDQARVSEDKIETILRDGNFYHSLAEFIMDLPIFPFAVIKGPVVKIIPKVVWPKGGGKPDVQQVPTLTWTRISPFDLWWTPGVGDIENANTIEKSSVTRAELNDLLDLPGYNHDEILAVLDEYGRGGLYDNWDTTDAERSLLESRENPAWNRSGMISVMEFNGNVQGRLLQDYGLAVPNELRDYHIQAWVIGAHVIKAQLTPNPRQRHPYFITSFEKVPGTPVGNGLTDLLTDMQESANATLRSMINNLCIASGPQVVVNVDRLSPEENPEDMFPWKRWYVRSDPLGNNAQVPVSFFMPTSNAPQLIQVYQAFVGIADDVSAIPKYVGGEASSGGAGRTASGLAMLMGNASKILQSVSANIDRDVLEPALMQLTDLVMLTDTTGLLTGEEKISVQGVNVAIQRETIRQRQIEFLASTNNPTDMEIMGKVGRAEVLRCVSQTIGMDGTKIIPSEAEMMKREQQAKQQQQSQGQQLAPHVDQGIARGVQEGVKRISTELTAGALAREFAMPEGMPTHIGTESGNPHPQPATNNPAISQNAAQAQGGQPKQLSGGGQGPQGLAPRTATVTGNMPGKDALPISPGVG